MNDPNGDELSKLLHEGLVGAEVTPRQELRAYSLTEQVQGQLALYATLFGGTADHVGRDLEPGELSLYMTASGILRPLDGLLDPEEFYAPDSLSDNVKWAMIESDADFDREEFSKESVYFNNANCETLKNSGKGRAQSLTTWNCNCPKSGSLEN